MTLYSDANAVEALDLMRYRITCGQFGVCDPCGSTQPRDSYRPLAFLQVYQQLRLDLLNAEMWHEQSARRRSLLCAGYPSKKWATVDGRRFGQSLRPAKCLVEQQGHHGRHLPERDQCNVRGSSAGRLHGSSVSANRKRSVAVHASGQVRKQCFIHALIVPGRVHK